MDSGFALHEADESACECEAPQVLLKTQKVKLWNLKLQSNMKLVLI